MFANDIMTKYTLRDLSYRYCEGAWQAWRSGKADAVADSGNPMLGGPMDARARGVTSYTKPDGTVVEISSLTRVRVRDLDAASITALGAAFGKDIAAAIAAADPKKAPGMDVLHPEFVGTYAENVANSEAFHLNNLSAVAATLDTLLSFYAPGYATRDELLAVITKISEDKVAATLFAVATRSAWIGRVVANGDWKVSGDFAWYGQLTKNVQALDTYVVVPTLERFAADLREGRLGL